jgi:hypothetical protein
MAFDHILEFSIGLVVDSKRLLLSNSAILLSTVSTIFESKNAGEQVQGRPPHQLNCKTRHQSYRTTHGKFTGNIHMYQEWIWKIARRGRTSKRKI